MYWSLAMKQYQKRIQILFILDEVFLKIVNGFQPITVFAKSSIIGVWLSTEFSSEHYNNSSNISKAAIHKYHGTVIKILCYRVVNTAQKIKFSIKDLVTFTEEIFNRKLFFFLQCNLNKKVLNLGWNERHLSVYFGTLMTYWKIFSLVCSVFMI